MEDCCKTSTSNVDIDFLDPMYKLKSINFNHSKAHGCEEIVFNVDRKQGKVTDHLHIILKAVSCGANNLNIHTDIYQKLINTIGIFHTGSVIGLDYTLCGECFAVDGSVWELNLENNHKIMENVKKLKQRRKRRK